MRIRQDSITAAVRTSEMPLARKDRTLFRCAPRLTMPRYTVYTPLHRLHFPNCPYVRFFPQTGEKRERETDAFAPDTATACRNLTRRVRGVPGHNLSPRSPRRSHRRCRRVAARPRVRKCHDGARSIPARAGVPRHHQYARRATRRRDGCTGVPSDR